MNRRRVIRSAALFVIPLLLVGTGVVLSSAGPAGAGGSKHKAKLVHVGPDVEGLSKVSFTCNTAAVGPTGGSGTWSVTLNNVQVIESDGSTEWPTPLTVEVLFGSNPQIVEIHSVDLTQNTTSGLFGATATGPIDHPANCATGQTAVVYGGDGTGEWFIAAMS